MRPGKGLELPASERASKSCAGLRSSPIPPRHSTSHRPGFQRSSGQTGFATISTGSTCRFLQTGRRRRAGCRSTSAGSRQYPASISSACPGFTNSNPHSCTAWGRCGISCGAYDEPQQSVAEFPLTRAKTAQRLRNAGRIFKLSHCRVMRQFCFVRWAREAPGRGRLTGVLDVVCFWHCASVLDVRYH